MKKHLKILLTFFVLCLFTFAFIMPLNPTGNWYQQFMPNLNGRTISDIFFIDSLTGWAVTPYLNVNDTSYLIKTTNSGDSWFIQHIRSGQFVGSNKVIFLNSTTGYTAGVSNLPAYSAILKTIDGGNTWSNINSPTSPFTARDISILSMDTIWTVSDNSLTGGVFFTSTGGSSWHNQYSAGSQNPEKIYMYNARIGFISDNSGTSSIRRTTNGGLNWDMNVNGDWFNDMKFADSLTGWYGNSGDKIYKTTNSGNNWITQYLPTGGIILTSNISRLSLLNKDTIWGAGGQLFFGSGRFRAMLYRTTNGGTNWLFSIPDTSLGIPALGYIQFINSNTGWAYNSYLGIHTTTGGDPVWLTGIERISSETPKEFELYQNYPNPFNAMTKLKFQMSKQGYAVIELFDITGRAVNTLVKEEMNAGSYSVDWDASNYPSGVYFYRLTIITGKEVFTETKRMLLIK